MSEPIKLTTERDCTVEAFVVGNAISLKAAGAHAPLFPAALLSLAEVEELQKGLGKLAAKLRGDAAKPSKFDTAEIDGHQ